MIVSANEIIAAGDHDFTKFSLVPSVILNVDIPESLEGSFYTAQGYISLKDTAFQASTSL